MMKWFLFLTLTWACSITAGALQCQTCTDAQCTNTILRNCTSGTRCIIASIEANVSGSVVQQLSKGCAAEAICSSNGIDDFTANLGVSSTYTSFFCCNTSNCNLGNVGFLSSDQSTNTLQCSSCNNSDCTSTIQCQGTQDRCFKANVTSGSGTESLYGCMSKNMCQAAAILGNLPFLESLGNITSGPSCCTGSLCNSANATAEITTAEVTTAGLLCPISGSCCVRLALTHMLLGLLVYILY